MNIAYQVVGEGAFDLVYVPGFVSNIDLIWEYPPLAHFFQRLASFSRLIFFDKRGTGLSDRLSPDKLPTLEERMDDVRAVMDAAGSERAVLFGHSEGGPMCLLFAATYPERTSALIVYGTYAKRVDPDEDYPWARTREERDRVVALAESDLLGGFLDLWLGTTAPSMVSEPGFRRWLGAYLRHGAGPRAAAALVYMNREIDVRHVLPLVRVPALVLCRTGDRSTRIEEARYIAARLPGARLVELPGEDHLFWVGDTDALVDEVQEFLTGVRPLPEVDRFLATVLFTDIAGGTAKAAALGDRRWRELMEQHHGIVRDQLRRFRGQEVDTAGDGFFATFDGPARAVGCALAVRDGVRPLGLEIRAGVHAGECETIAGKVGGLAVIIGARVREQARPGEVLVSSTVRDLVAGSGLRFEDRGSRALKGVPGDWRLFAAV